jgi:hypothetical protein
MPNGQAASSGDSVPTSIGDEVLWAAIAQLTAPSPDPRLKDLKGALYHVEPTQILSRDKFAIGHALHAIGAYCLDTDLMRQAFDGWAAQSPTHKPEEYIKWGAYDKAKPTEAIDQLFVIAAKHGYKRAYDLTDASISTASIADREWVVTTLPKLAMEQLGSLLQTIPANKLGYHEWRAVGEALHWYGQNNGGVKGYNTALETLWDGWSEFDLRPGQYDAGQCRDLWREFREAGETPSGDLVQIMHRFGVALPLVAADNVLPFRRADSPEDDQEGIGRSEVATVMDLAQSGADIEALLPSLYKPLTAKARRFNVPVEPFVGDLLGVGGSLLPSKTRLVIEAGYAVPPILWVGNVGKSGAAKSPILQALINALLQLQAEEFGQYQHKCTLFDQQLEAWNKDRKGPKPQAPILRHYYTGDATIEAIVQIMSNQPNNGLAVIVDELAGLVNGFNEYKGGGGADQQRWLTAYNGAPLKSDRKNSGTLMADRPNICIVGTIQPSVLEKLMGDTEQVNGFWPRFLWFGVPTTVMPAPGEVPEIDLTDTLKAIYRRLGESTIDAYGLSPEARIVFNDWHRYTEARKMQASSEAVQAIYPKAREQAARIALIAHHIEAAAKSEAPSALISGVTMSAAISLAKYCVNQALLLYGTDPDTIRITNFVTAHAGKTVSWADARSYLPRIGKARKAAKKPECVEFLRQVVELGYGFAAKVDYSAIVVTDQTAQPQSISDRAKSTDSEVA